MNLLLDTHVWIWAAQAPENLGPKTRALLSSRENELLVSPISTLEIARLISAGRILITGNVADWVEESVVSLGLRTAGLDHRIAIGAYDLPGGFHPDPADRILVSTARLQGLSLVTADRRILAYEQVSALDARA